MQRRAGIKSDVRLVYETAHRCAIVDANETPRDWLREKTHPFKRRRRRRRRMRYRSTGIGSGNHLEGWSLPGKYDNAHGDDKTDDPLSRDFRAGRPADWSLSREFGRNESSGGSPRFFAAYQRTGSYFIPVACLCFSVC